MVDGQKRVKASLVRAFRTLIWKRGGVAVGILTTHSDHFLGCGESDLLPKAFAFLEPRMGDLRAQETIR